MPYDDQKTLDGKVLTQNLSLKLRLLEGRLNSIRDNLDEIQTLIIKPSSIEKTPKLDPNGVKMVDESGKPIMEDVTIPAVTKVRNNPRTFNEFTDAERVKIQTDTLTELVKVKLEVDKLS